MTLPAMAAAAFYFLLYQKVTKNQVSKDASLRTWPLPCKTDKTTGCIILPQALRANSTWQKDAMPLLPHRPPCFISFHPKLFC